MSTDLKKLQEFEGRVGASWKVPDTYRRWAAGSKKILKLWFRMKKDNVWWPQLVRELSVATSVYVSLGEQLYQAKTEEDPILLNELRTTLTWENRKLAGQTVIEETRDREQGHRCSLCRTQLVFPAYIVTREGDRVTNKSRSIGIHCLHHAHGKLNKLLTGEELKKLVTKLRNFSSADPELQQALETLFEVKYGVTA